MDLVQSSVLLSNDVVFLRVIIRYGERLFYWNEHHLEKLFAGLRETINSLIFIHNDCYISKEKPKLSPQYSRQMLKQANDSLHNPITFVANFNFDCDSEDTGPRVEFKPPQKVPCAMHQLNVDAFFAVDPEIVEGDLFDTLRSNVSEFLTSYNETLKSILAKEKSIPRSLTAYYFHHEDKLIRVFYPPFCEKELQWREAIHKGWNRRQELGLCLPLTADTCLVVTVAGSGRPAARIAHHQVHSGGACSRRRQNCKIHRFSAVDRLARGEFLPARVVWSAVPSSSSITRRRIHSYGCSRVGGSLRLRRGPGYGRRWPACPHHCRRQHQWTPCSLPHPRSPLHRTTRQCCNHPRKGLGGMEGRGVLAGRCSL
uniref:Ufm1-specific protease 2 n=1 Tax=Mesocestoides corti TaxID=53468 RepID=A0A5K3F4L3_MESCO